MLSRLSIAFVVCPAVFVVFAGCEQSAPPAAPAPAEPVIRVPPVAPAITMTSAAPSASETAPAPPASSSAPVASETPPPPAAPSEVPCRTWRDCSWVEDPTFRIVSSKEAKRPRGPARPCKDAESDVICTQEKICRRVAWKC